MTQLSDGKNARQQVVSFMFPAPVARCVSLAGDFNNWDLEDMPMYKGTNGVWYLSVLLTPGSHEYRFFADGVWRDDPAAEQKIANVMGSENCVKMVGVEISGEAVRRQSSTVPRGITL